MIKKNKKFLKIVYIFFSIFILAAIAMFIPFDLIISEKKIFQVVDENGNPIPNCKVEHEWTQYSLMFYGSDTTSSDENGFVFLPERSVKTTLAKLIQGAYIKIQMYGLHASFSSDDIVTIRTPNYETTNIFTDFRFEDKVILKKRQPR